VEVRGTALLTSALMTASIAASGALALELTGPPIALTQPAGESWRRDDSRDNPQAWAVLRFADGEAARLTLSCTAGRGTVILHRDSNQTEPLRITMVLRASGRAVLSEEASYDVFGFSTRWVEMAPFLRAMRQLKGRTQLQFEMQGGTRKTVFNVRLASGSGFGWVAEKCARFKG
jgi:hypothetical protein